MSEMKEKDRPIVHVEACTANTCAIEIETQQGIIRIVAGHESIIVYSGGAKIEVRS